MKALVLISGESMVLLKLVSTLALILVGFSVALELLEQTACY